MKKLIDFNDNLIERLEKLKDKFNVKSLAPIIDIVLTIGLTHFEEFVNGTVYINPYTYYYPWYQDPSTPNWSWNTGIITIPGTSYTIYCNNITGEQNVES